MILRPIDIIVHKQEPALLILQGLQRFQRAGNPKTPVNQHQIWQRKLVAYFGGKIGILAEFVQSLGGWFANDERFPPSACKANVGVVKYLIILTVEIFLLYLVLDAIEEKRI